MPNVVIGIVAVLVLVWAIMVMMLPLSFSQEYQAQPPPKLLDSASSYKDDSSFGTGENQLIVSGHIMNNFSAPIGSVSVSATYFDGSGNMVGQSSGVTPEFIL